MCQHMCTNIRVVVSVRATPCAASMLGASIRVLYLTYQPANSITVVFCCGAFGSIFQ
ncbi:hypothetical protein LZ30DRAFT_739060 [Colletotrichum cereale]|nr:hypothetical protein LZ30DRAFT_739060 [Colletotrichum cereale]